MKNTITKTILFFALYGSILSCKKEEQLSFPITLYPTQLIQNTQVRVFTKNQEIKDANTIANFIKNANNFSLDFRSSNPDDKIVFTSKTNILIGEYGRGFDLVKGDISNKNELVFYSQNSIYDVNPLEFSRKILKFTAPLIPVATIPTPSDNGIKYISQEVMVFNGNYSNLDLSVLSYKIKQGGQNSFSIKTSTTFNKPVEFNASFLAELQPTDTIAVQEYTYNFKAR